MGEAHQRRHGLRCQCSRRRPAGGRRPDGLVAADPGGDLGRAAQILSTAAASYHLGDGRPRPRHRHLGLADRWRRGALLSRRTRRLPAHRLRPDRRPRCVGWRAAAPAGPDGRSSSSRSRKSASRPAPEINRGYAPMGSESLRATASASTARRICTRLSTSVSDSATAGLTRSCSPPTSGPTGRPCVLRWSTSPTARGSPRKRLTEIAAVALDVPPAYRRADRPLGRRAAGQPLPAATEQTPRRRRPDADGPTHRLRHPHRAPGRRRAGPADHPDGRRLATACSADTVAGSWSTSAARSPWTNDRWKSTLHRVVPPPSGVTGESAPALVRLPRRQPRCCHRVPANVLQPGQPGQVLTDHRQPAHRRTSCSGHARCSSPRRCRPWGSALSAIAPAPRAGVSLRSVNPINRSHAGALRPAATTAISRWRRQHRRHAHRIWRSYVRRVPQRALAWSAVTVVIAVVELVPLALDRDSTRCRRTRCSTRRSATERFHTAITRSGETVHRLSPERIAASGRGHPGGGGRVAAIAYSESLPCARTSPARRH